MEFTTLTKMKIPIEILPSFAVNLSDKQLQMRFERRQQTLHLEEDLNGDTVDRIRNGLNDSSDSHVIDPSASPLDQSLDSIPETGVNTEITKVKNTITVITS